MFFTFWSIKEGPKPEAVATVIASKDVDAKLNFLIDSRTTQDVGPVKWYFAGMFALFVMLYFSGSFLDRAYPRNIFYWGKQAQAYDRLLGIREKVVWGVVIAFVIGIASSVAVDFFKAPAKTTALTAPITGPIIRAG
jgi:hypothetical protein